MTTQKTSKQDLQYRAERLNEIHMEMNNLLNEARRLVRGTPEAIRAEAYWIPHIRASLQSDVGGGGSPTMETSVENLSELADEHAG